MGLAIRRALRKRCSKRLVAWRGSTCPGPTVTVMPLAGIARLGPQAAFVVLHRQLLELRVELLVTNSPGIELAFQVDVAAVRFLEIYLALSKIHSLPFVSIVHHRQCDRYLAACQISAETYRPESSASITRRSNPYLQRRR